GDSYDSSRLLLIGNTPPVDQPKDYAVVVSSRDALFIGDLGDESTVDALHRLTVMDSQERVRPLSPIPLRYVDGEWTDWTPPNVESELPSFSELRLHFLMEIYDSQKQILDDEDDLQLFPEFIASFTLYKTEQEDIVSYSVWSQSIETLLPETDQIALANLEGDTLLVPWKIVQEEVGELMQRVEGLYPPRYRVTEFPNAQQRKRLAIFDEYPDAASGNDG
ncbi:MAG: hypothetical protein AAFP90_07950, partial [Planctomycetota bacterium]